MLLNHTSIHIETRKKIFKKAFCCWDGNISEKWGPSFFYCSFFITSILQLMVVCRLCVIYVSEDNDSNV